MTILFLYLFVQIRLTFEMCLKLTHMVNNRYTELFRTQSLNDGIIKYLGI